MCCGHPNLPPTFSPAAGGSIDHLTFEYQGPGPLTLYGRVTGLRYHFPGPSARVLVDGRDAPYLEVIRGLTVVAATGSPGA
jgi:hypothetical protein